MNKTEEWRDVVEYEGLYAVSNLGRVKRVGKAPGTRPGYIISTPKNGDGYPCMRLHKDGKRSTVRVHRLVAQAFLGPAPADFPEVNHLDGDKTNNKPENLEYTNRSGNLKHAFRTLGREPVRGSAVITEKDVAEIRKLAAQGITHRKIASFYPIGPSQVGRIIKRQCWSQVE